MSERLASGMLVSALLRRASAEGGFAAVIRRGDATSGTIIVHCLDRGTDAGLFERVPDLSGAYRLVPCGPPPGAPEEELADYLSRRARVDPDLWIVELDVAEAKRFADETMR